jgi:hypothetical protein
VLPLAHPKTHRYLQLRSGVVSICVSVEIWCDGPHGFAVELAWNSYIYTKLSKAYLKLYKFIKQIFSHLGYYT